VKESQRNLISGRNIILYLVDDQLGIGEISLGQIPFNFNFCWYLDAVHLLILVVHLLA